MKIMTTIMIIIIALTLILQHHCSYDSICAFLVRKVREERIFFYELICLQLRLLKHCRFAEYAGKSIPFFCPTEKVFSPHLLSTGGSPRGRVYDEHFTRKYTHVERGCAMNSFCKSLRKWELRQEVISGLTAYQQHHKKVYLPPYLLLKTQDTVAKLVRVTWTW